MRRAGEEEIVVTGSRVRRKDLTTPAPVTVLTRQQLEESGKVTIGEFLQLMPEQGNAPNFQLNNGGATYSADGSTRINLRSLGVTRTLVLVNGRRMVPAGVGASAAVDLNSIPTAAVDHIEVLKDGASAIYGSDAIAGVVNVITRKSFNATQGYAQYGVSSKGDAQTLDAAVTTGTSGSAGNLLFSAGYFNQGESWLRDRYWSANALGYDYTTGKTQSAGSLRTPQGVIGLPSDPKTGNPLPECMSIPHATGNGRTACRGGRRKPATGLHVESDLQRDRHQRSELGVGQFHQVRSDHGCHVHLEGRQRQVPRLAENAGRGHVQLCCGELPDDSVGTDPDLLGGRHQVRRQCSARLLRSVVRAAQFAAERCPDAAQSRRLHAARQRRTHRGLCEQPVQPVRRRAPVRRPPPRRVRAPRVQGRVEHVPSGRWIRRHPLRSVRAAARLVLGRVGELRPHVGDIHDGRSDPELTDPALRRFIRRIGPENLDRQFTVRAADIAGSGLPPNKNTLGLNPLSRMYGRISPAIRKPSPATASAVGSRDVPTPGASPPSGEA